MQFSVSNGRPLGAAAKLRIIVAVFLLAAIAFNGQIADALTMQGDSDLAAGRTQRALTSYARAVAFDPQSIVAVTRYNNAAYFYGDDVSRRAALRYGRLRLVREDKNKELLLGMGLNALRIGDDYTAANIYVRLGLLTHSPGYLVMAGYAMHRTGDDALARKTFALALKVQPGNISAMHALHRIPERA